MISKIFEKLKDPAYRKAFVASQINIGIPFQIRALMNSRGWTQQILADKTGMLQPRISGLMTPGKVRPNIETLRRVAEACDCALIVRFAPFSELAKWSDEFEPDSYIVPSFENDTGFIERKPSESAAGLIPQYAAASAGGYWTAPADVRAAAGSAYTNAANNTLSSTMIITTPAASGKTAANALPFPTPGANQGMPEYA